MITGELKAACRDYYYLLSQGYPERGSLKMVGDRYRLTRDQRSILYRGISSEPGSSVRKNRLINLHPNVHLIIDGYNVLFTILNYRLGRMVFISTDNILRDAGSLHGKLRDDTILQECIDDLFQTILPFDPIRIDLFLDSPVTSSHRHQQLIEQKIADFKFTGICSLVHSADKEIRSIRSGVLATSDTVLIDKTSVPVTDLARLVLKTMYRAAFIRIQEMLEC